MVSESGREGKKVVGVSKSGKMVGGLSKVVGVKFAKMVGGHRKR